MPDGLFKYLFLIGLAQVLMLPNLLAGPACLALFLPVYLVRVLREERMMLDHFGEAYRVYMHSTGAIIPHPGK
jgi:protein-S-isoprenylcysteine O-methyltransferase Ste14